MSLSLFSPDKSGYVNQHPNYQTTACKKKKKRISLILVCYSFTSSLLISTQTLVTAQTPLRTGLTDQHFVCLRVMTHSEAHPSLCVLLAERNKQVFVVRKLTPHSCRVRVHMQGLKVRWPRPCGSRMFETTIMFLPVSTCVWVRCGCVFGGSGISVTDVDY